LCVYECDIHPPESITISFQDNDWVQPIDYEHIPFRCRKCHEHGHLFWDFPQNQALRNNKGKEEKDTNDFVKTPNKRKVGRRGNKTLGEGTKQDKQLPDLSRARREHIQPGRSEADKEKTLTSH
jgi:hypothetical protein